MEAICSPLAKLGRTFSYVVEACFDMFRMNAVVNLSSRCRSIAFLHAALPVILSVFYFYI
jgi:hypothetical protein